MGPYRDGWKGDRSGVHLKERTGEPARSPKIISDSISEDSPQGKWDHMAERMLVELAESGCPIFRGTSPLSRGRVESKGHEKLSIHYAAELETIETIFRRNVRRVRDPSRQIGATRCQRGIKFLTRAERDHDRNACGL